MNTGKNSGSTRVNLAAKPRTQKLIKGRQDGYYSKIAPKAISQARVDIANWKNALRQAQAIFQPKRVKLQLLYNDIANDALLTSMIENRRRQTLGSGFTLKNAAGEVDDDSTALLKSSMWYAGFCLLRPHRLRVYN